MPSSWGKRTDMLVHELDPYNAEPPLAALAGKPVTAVDTFYSRNHGPVPDVDATTWQLRVDGLVDTPLTLGMADLQRFRRRTVPATLQCAGNRRAGLLSVRDIPGEDPWRGGATGTASWTGVALADVLAAAGLQEPAQHVAFTAPDVSRIPDPPETYGASVPVGKATSPEVLLAWEMNGEPLTRLHGAPVRVVVPGWIGARSVKWVDRITATAEPFDGHFQAVAYRLLPPDGDPDAAGPDDGPSLGPVALNCEILDPPEGFTTTGRTTVTGYAYAGEDRRVVRVDVSADGGATWVQADVDRPDGWWTWQHWRAEVDLPAGPAHLLARAWDSTGALQPQHPADLWNPKGYANNSWARTSGAPRQESADG